MSKCVLTAARPTTPPEWVPRVSYDHPATRVLAIPAGNGPEMTVSTPELTPPVLPKLKIDRLILPTTQNDTRLSLVVKFFRNIRRDREALLYGVVIDAKKALNYSANVL